VFFARSISSGTGSGNVGFSARTPSGCVTLRRMQMSRPRRSARSAPIPWFAAGVAPSTLSPCSNRRRLPRPCVCLVSGASGLRRRRQRCGSVVCSERGGAPTSPERHGLTFLRRALPPLSTVGGPVVRGSDPGYVKKKTWRRAGSPGPGGGGGCFAAWRRLPGSSRVFAAPADRLHGRSEMADQAHVLFASVRLAILEHSRHACVFPARWQEKCAAPATGGNQGLLRGCCAA